MSVYDELSKLDAVSPGSRAQKRPKRTRVAEAHQKNTKSTAKKSVDQSTSPSVDRPTGQSIDQSTDQLTDIDALGPVVERPRAFYITQKLDRWLEDSVRYLKGKGLHKVDRSVLINALLHDPEHFKPRFLDKIRSRLLAHMTNKSLKRLQSTD